MVKYCLALLLCLLPTLTQPYIFSGSITNGIAIDYSSGSVLFEHSADEKMHPSSMSKLMTLYVAFSKLKSGTVKMTDIYKVNKSAWKVGGSSMFLEIRQGVTVQDLLRGIIIVSGNDAAITLAEGSSGSQENFVKEMNGMAQRLNLIDSHFVNPTGLTDESHLMSARDLVNLAIKIYEDFPEYYYLFQEKEFTYNRIYQPNTNELLWSDLGVNGLKTGLTEAAGFGVVISAEQDGRRIFAVINGLKSKRDRRREGEKLIQYAFNNFNHKLLFKSDEVIEEANVWFGKEMFVPMVAKQNVTIVYQRGEEKDIKVSTLNDNGIPAPIKKGQKIGLLKISVPNQKLREITLYALNDVEKLGPISYFLRKAKIIFKLL